LRTQREHHHPEHHVPHSVGEIEKSISVGKNLSNRIVIRFGLSLSTGAAELMKTNNTSERKPIFELN
jgi:hypothetical protein